MKQREYSFKKKHSNTNSLKNWLIIICLMISGAFAFRFYLEIDLVKNIDTLSNLFIDSLIFSLVSISSFIAITTAYQYLSKPWYYWKYRFKLNKLFEQLAKNQTLSKNMIFPKVKFSHDENIDKFSFKFVWDGKISSIMQDEIVHRLSEILFPNNEYLLEEPIKEQAYTTFRYSRKSERLYLDLSKVDDTIYDRKIRLNSNLFWDLDKQSHCSVTGSTNSGKTMFVYYLIYEAAKLNSDIYIIDAKRADLSTLHSVKEIAETTEDIVALFETLINEMDQRFEAIKKTNEPQKTAADIGYKDAFLFIDELAVVIEMAKTIDIENKVKNKKHSKETGWEKLSENNYIKIISSLKILIFKARQASIHILLCAQVFSSELLGSTSTRDNLSMRVLLGNASNVQVNQMGLTQEQVPSIDYSQTGSGMIWLEGQGWINARGFDTPYLDFHNLRPNDILENHLEVGKVLHANK